MNEIKQLLADRGISQAELSRRFEIPLRTVEDWCAGRRTPPPYVINMIRFCIERRLTMSKNYDYYLNAIASVCPDGKPIDSLTTTVYGTSIALCGKAAAVYLFGCVDVDEYVDEDGAEYRLYKNALGRGTNLDLLCDDKLHADWISFPELVKRLVTIYDELCSRSAIYADKCISCDSASAEDPGALSIQLFPGGELVPVACSEWVEYEFGEIDDNMYVYASVHVFPGDTIETAAQRIADHNRRDVLYAIAESSILVCGEDRYILPVGADLVEAVMQEAESHLLDPREILEEAARMEAVYEEE